jgi:hypothetical protein
MDLLVLVLLLVLLLAMLLAVLLVLLLALLLVLRLVLLLRSLVRASLYTIISICQLRCELESKRVAGAVSRRNRDVDLMRCKQHRSSRRWRNGELING